MDNTTRKLLGLTDKNLFFDDDLLEERKYKGVKDQIIKGNLTNRFPHCLQCGAAVRIIRSGFYITNS